MKICFVCNEYPPLPGGGIGIFVQTMAEELARLGVEVWVAGYGRKGPRPFTRNGVRVFWLSLPSILYRSIAVRGYPYSAAGLIRRHYLSFHLNRLVQAEHIDIVESHDFSGPLALMPPAKLVLRLHGSVFAYRLAEGRPGEIHPVDRLYEMRQLRMPGKLVAVSKHIGELTGQALGERLKVQVIYNAVDTSLFTPRPIARDGSILFVGNLMWRKGILDLVKAFPLVLKTHPSARLKIAGGAGGVHQQRLEAALADIPEDARLRVDLLGKVPHEDLPALYSRTNVFVFPSRVEAFGLACAEAMACASPVVATCLASGPELVEDGVSGLLADPADASDLAGKINLLLDDPELAGRLGDNARQRVLEKFDLRDMGPRNLAFYGSLL